MGNRAGSVPEVVTATYCLLAASHITPGSGVLAQLTGFAYVAGKGKGGGGEGWSGAERGGGGRGLGTSSNKLRNRRVAHLHGHAP
jgi:hypothetical protein